MKSRFFKDTQGLESAFEPCTPDRVSVCVRVSREAYAQIVREACRLRLTSGEYLDRLVLRDAEPERRLH